MGTPPRLAGTARFPTVHTFTGLSRNQEGGEEVLYQNHDRSSPGRVYHSWQFKGSPAWAGRHSLLLHQEPEALHNLRGLNQEKVTGGSGATL